MKRAQKMDAILKEKFFFRTNITATCSGTDASAGEAIIEEMTIDQIMNGAPEFKFPGLLNLVQDYLRNIEVETDTMCTLSRYWIYLQKKCTGQLMTNARFIRNFVTQVYSKCLTMLVKSLGIGRFFFSESTMPGEKF